MFEMTSEGYAAALEWLSDNNHEALITRELSNDGYTIIALANGLVESD